MTAVLDALYHVLFVLALALGVRIVVDRFLGVPYSVVLILAGVAVSALSIDIGFQLSEELVMAVFLPAILFEGAGTLDRAALRENVVVSALLVVFGVPLAVVLLGIVSAVVFDLPLLVSFVLAAIIVPTDPVAVLSLFEEIDAPAHLSTLIESESLFNDGVAVTIVAVLVSLLADGSAVEFDVPITAVLVELLVVGLGGFFVGSTLGYAAGIVARLIRERMTVLLLTILVAYGSYIVADGVVGVSGILATVGTGLFMDITDEESDFDGSTTAFVRDAWDAGAFLVTTVVYVLIGAQVPLDSVLQRAPAVLVAAVLVLLVRAVVVMTTIAAANHLVATRVPIGYQYVLVWGGLHTVVPIGLALGLPKWVPHRDFIQVVVFGVAILGALVQGSVLPSLLRLVGIRDRPSWVDSTSRS